MDFTRSAPEYGSLPFSEKYSELSFGEKFLVGQKILKRAVLDVASSYQDALLRPDIEGGEGLIAYLARRAEERKKADDVQVCNYIIEKEIGPVATREAVELERDFLLYF